VSVFHVLHNIIFMMLLILTLFIHFSRYIVFIYIFLNYAFSVILSSSTTLFSIHLFQLYFPELQLSQLYFLESHFFQLRLLQRYPQGRQLFYIIHFSIFQSFFRFLIFILYTIPKNCTAINGVTEINAIIPKPLTKIGCPRR